MAPKYHLNHVTTTYPFMTCIVKVSTQSYGQRTVAKVLDKCHGVHSFRMDDNGVVEISGTVDPSVLLKMLGRAGRSAELCWFQFGECSNNLFMPTSLTGSARTTYSRDGRYLHASNLSRPKLPSHEALVKNHSYGYDQYGNGGHDHHYYSYGNRHPYQLTYGDQTRDYAAYQLAYDEYKKQDHAYQLAYGDQKQDNYHAHARDDDQYQTRNSSSGGDDVTCCIVM
ncbi:hypothetical protein C2S52_005875 [Perilla frutescens var. hirtella]|nr:hypothetical protein C2S52_005875 [Perilla frutescens var. hirtella]